MSPNLLLRSPFVPLVLCNLNTRLPEMTLKEQAMLFHSPCLYTCYSNWNAWAISNASLCVCMPVLSGFSHILLFATLRITACQALLCMHFSR